MTLSFLLLALATARAGDNTSFALPTNNGGTVILSGDDKLFTGAVQAVVDRVQVTAQIQAPLDQKTRIAALSTGEFDAFRVPAGFGGSLGVTWTSLGSAPLPDAVCALFGLSAGCKQVPDSNKDHLTALALVLADDDKTLDDIKSLAATPGFSLGNLVDALSAANAPNLTGAAAQKDAFCKGLSGSCAQFSDDLMEYLNGTYKTRGTSLAYQYGFLSNPNIEKKPVLTLSLKGSLSGDSVEAYRDDLAADPVRVAALDLGLTGSVGVVSGATTIDFGATVQDKSGPSRTAFQRCKSLPSTDEAITGQTCKDAIFVSGPDASLITVNPTVTLNTLFGKIDQKAKFQAIGKSEPSDGVSVALGASASLGYEGTWKTIREGDDKGDQTKQGFLTAQGSLFAVPLADKTRTTFGAGFKLRYALTNNEDEGYTIGDVAFTPFAIVSGVLDPRLKP